MAAFNNSSSSFPPTHLYEEVTQENLLENLSFPTPSPSPQNVQPIPTLPPGPPYEETILRSPFSSIAPTPFYHNVQQIPPTQILNHSPILPPLPPGEIILRSPFPSITPTPFYQNIQPIPQTQVLNHNPINFNSNNIGSGNPRINISPRIRTSILNISPGIDIIKTVIQFASARSLYVTVYAGIGKVSYLDICCPLSQNTPMQLFGNFEIFGFVGIYNGCASSSSSSLLDMYSNSFTVKIQIAEGQIMGGIVATSIIASSSVVLVISTSDTPTPSS